MTLISSTSTRPPIKVRLENFRLFRDSGWFKLAPLTCLVGRNSSGKSSIVSALLLLKQSIEQETMGSGVTPLVLNGPYCDLGTYRDVVHDHDETSEISFSFSVDLANDPMGMFQRRGPFPHLSVPRATRYGFYYRWMDTKLPDPCIATVRLTFSADEPFGPSLSGLEVEVQGEGAASFVRTISGERQQHWRVYTTTLPPRSLRLRILPRSFFPLVEYRPKFYDKAAPRTKHKISVVAAACQYLFRLLEQTLSRSDSIGPFRTPPERRYPFAGFSAGRSGPTGEQAVNLLITESLLKSRGERSLQKAVSFWIRHLRLASSIEVKDIAKRLNLFELDIAGAGLGTTANVADVGFGISQVLPVLVQGLLMQRGGIYLVQQPEIHLHPDAQAGLADFFIYLAGRGVIAVVETHSEYLLLRLRRRLAEGPKQVARALPKEDQDISRIKTSDVAVLYSGSKHKVAMVRELEIGSSFQFENLPDGFMSQALDDRVALLTAVGKHRG